MCVIYSATETVMTWQDINNMKRDHIYTAAIMLFIVVGLMSSLMISFRKQAKLQSANRDLLTVKLDSIKRECDSLNAEIFTLKIQLGRYEYILDRAEDEMSRECKKQLDEIVKNTE